jgi:hypothetical protein
VLVEQEADAACSHDPDDRGAHVAFEAMRAHSSPTAGRLRQRANDLREA